MTDRSKFSKIVIPSIRNRQNRIIILVLKYIYLNIACQKRRLISRVAKAKKYCVSKLQCSGFWNEQGKHARLPTYHLQFSVWLLLWAFSTRFHAHLVDMQISGSWWRPIFAVGCERCNKTTCIYYTYVRQCRAARRGTVFTFTKWRGLPWEIGCNHSDVKVSRSRTQAREPSLVYLWPARVRGLGVPRSRRTSSPRHGSRYRWRERWSEGNWTYISSVSLPSPLPPPVRISASVNNKILERVCAPAARIPAWRQYLIIKTWKNM